MTSTNESSTTAANEKIWQALFGDISNDENFPAKTPLLAHYCSTTTLEAIFKHEELWFSNPLFMNDHEELRFGVSKGMETFFHSKEIGEALGDTERQRAFYNAIHAEFKRFDSERALEIFAVCFSEYVEGDDDGLLSMWRGYGDNGNGAAIVFDTGKLVPRTSSPLIISKVSYGSTEQRLEQLRKIVFSCATILAKLNLQIEQLAEVANMAFERILRFALFTKHKGFHEEREWRVVYLPHHDSEKRLVRSIGYHVGPAGLQPKLKFKIGKIDDAADDVTLANLVHKIILGPTGVAPLKMASTQMMLRHLDKPELADRVVISGTPFRPT